MSRIIAPQWVNRRKRGEGLPREEARRLVRDRYGLGVSDIPHPWGIWDASDLSHDHANNDPVASWPDRSENDNPFTQGTGAKQPLFKTSQINGHPAVEFDGSDDLLVNTGIPDDSFPADREWQGHTRVVVFQRVGANGAVLAWGNSESTNSFSLWRVTSGNWAIHVTDDGADGGGPSGFQNSDTSWHIETIVDTGATFAQYEDGTNQGYVSFGSTNDLTVTHLSMAALKRTTESNQFNCRVAWCGIFPIMSKAEMNRLHAALGARFGITVSTIT